VNFFGSNVSVPFMRGGGAKLQSASPDPDNLWDIVHREVNGQVEVGVSYGEAIDRNPRRSIVDPQNPGSPT
jgi:hypothetical protein